MQTLLPSSQQLKHKLFHKQTVQISEQTKFPKLFKWKTASLILGSLSAVLLIILLVVVYNLQSQGQIKINLTFLESIIDNTNILTKKQQILNLNQNFQFIYGTTKFQNAKFLGRSNILTQNFLKDQIYNQQNSRLMYLFSVKNAQLNQYKFAIFMNSAFPVPKGQNFNYNITYYSFQTKQQQKSALLSLNNEQTLRLSTQSPSIKSISQCRTYNFKTDQNTGVYFSLLSELLHFNMQKQSKKVEIKLKNRQCFNPLLSETQFTMRLKNILGWDIQDETQQMQLKEVQIFHLQ